MSHEYSNPSIEWDKPGTYNRQLTRTEQEFRDAIAEAVAAERERWQVVVDTKLAASFQHGWNWTKTRNEIFAAIRKGE